MATRRELSAVSWRRIQRSLLGNSPRERFRTPPARGVASSKLHPPRPSSCTSSGQRSWFQVISREALNACVVLKPSQSIENRFVDFLWVMPKEEQTSSAILRSCAGPLMSAWGEIGRAAGDWQL